MKILLLGCNGQVGWELQRALAAVSKQLAGLTGVNRQALDQYTSFIDQRKDLVERKARRNPCHHVGLVSPCIYD